MTVNKKLLLVVATILILLVGGGIFFVIRSHQEFVQKERKKALALAREGKYTEALELFEKYPYKDPVKLGIDTSEIQAELLAARGNLRLSEFKFADAIKDLEATRSLSPMVRVEEELTLAYAYNGDFEKALSIINPAIQASPDKTRFYLVRAIVYWKMNNKSGMNADITKVRELDPNYPIPKYLLGS